MPERVIVVLERIQQLDPAELARIVEAERYDWKSRDDEPLERDLELYHFPR